MPRTTRTKAPIGVAVRQLVLITGLLIMLPLLFYPRRVGFPAMDLNPATSLFEWVFYIAVLSISSSRLPFSTRVVAGGFTVVYRMATAVLSGIFLGVAQGHPWGQITVEMMWSYPLAVIPQVLVAAVALTPLWDQLFSSRSSSQVVRHSRTVISKTGTHTIPAKIHTKSASASRVAATKIRPSEPSFDDAVSYVGDYSGVRLCWIVDGEGLPLAVWQRQEYTGDADFWAPTSVEMMDFHRSRMSNGGPVCEPDRLEVRSSLGRIIVEGVDSVWLGVLTDPETDELIGLRISRARDMIARHMQEQGGHLAAVREEDYV